MSFVQITYHWSNLVLDLSYSINSFHNILFAKSENYKIILTFKRDQEVSFQFRLFSVIILTSVKVTAFLDFCLHYKDFY